MPCSFFALVLNRSCRRSRRCQNHRRKWPTIFFVAPRQPRSKPLTRAPLHHRPTHSIAATPLKRITCGTQIPIAPAAPQTYPFPRFPPLQAFGRRPTAHAAPPAPGRHPKPCTRAVHRRPGAIRCRRCRDTSFPYSAEPCTYAVCPQLQFFAPGLTEPVHTAAPASPTVLVPCTARMKTRVLAGSSGIAAPCPWTNTEKVTV
jgi:hypothetical protein